MDFRAQLVDWMRNPRAWVLRANPVWGRSETVNQIALFDTKEAAEEYLEKSKLPEDWTSEQRATPDKYCRTFRPDSLLWDYNPDAFFDLPMVIGMIPWHIYENLEHNPAPPTGPIPPVDGMKPAPAQYGKDYDVGFGGPRTNMDQVRPERGDVETQGQLTEGEKDGSS